MRDDKVIQHELDAAQADLERRVGQLKEALVDKLEMPVRVLDYSRSVMAVIDRNPLAATAAAFVIGLLLGARRAPTA